MNKFKPGQIVLGIKDNVLYRIPDPKNWAENWSSKDCSFEENMEPCMTCGNPDCVSYANIQALNKDLTPLKWGGKELWGMHMGECAFKPLDN